MLLKDNFVKTVRGQRLYALYRVIVFAFLSNSFIYNKREMKKIFLLGAAATMFISAPELRAGVNATITGPHTVCLGAPVNYSCAITHTSTLPRIGMWWTFTDCSTPNWADSIPPTLSFWTPTALYVTLNVKDTADGSTVIINYPVTVDPRPDISSPYFSSSTLDCATSSIPLSASSTDSSAQIIWTLPDATNDTIGNISAVVAGNYSVVALNSYGCFSYGLTRIITSSPSPIAQIFFSSTGGTTIGNTDGSPHLDTVSLCQGTNPTLGVTNYAGGFSWPLSYSWNNGSISNHYLISTDTAGYQLIFVTVTDERGCTSTDSICINVLQIPVVSITPSPSSTYFCVGDTAVFHLPSGDGYTYAWRRNYYVGMGYYYSDTVSVTDTAKFTVNSNVNVMVTNRICNSYNSFSINFINPPTPYINVSASLGYDGVSDTIKACSGISHEVFAGYSYEYYSGVPLSILWGDGRTSSNFALDTSGRYTLYISDSVTGCHGFASKFIKIYNSPDSLISLSDSGNLCIGESITLKVIDTTAGNSYSWGYYGNFSDSLVATYSGSYFCNVTNSFGCVTSCIKNLTFHDLPSPSITVGTCEAVVDFANITSVYQWYLLETPIFGATSEYYNTLSTGGGLYRVKETTNFGCSAFSSYGDVVCIDTVESSFIISSHTICGNGNISVTNTSHVSRPTSSICTWNFTGGTPSTFVGWNPPVVYFSGSGLHTISLSVIDTPSGVSSSYSDIVNVDSINIKVYATSASGAFDTSFDSYICRNYLPTIGVVVHSGMPPFSYSWNYGATTSSFSTTIPGEQIVEVSDVSGCTVKDSINLHIMALPDTTTVRTLGNCLGDITSLHVMSAMGVSLHWSTGATGHTISVTTPGIYSVILTDTFGCVSTNSYPVTFNPLPFIAIDATSVDWVYGSVGSVDTANICSNVASDLYISTSASSVLWSNGATTLTIPVSMTGMYSITATSSVGCIAHDSVFVYVHNAPDSNIVQIGRSCVGDTVLLTAVYDPNASYFWNNGDTAQSIRVTNSVPFMVTVSNEYCISHSVSHVVVYNALPTPVVEAYSCNMTVAVASIGSTYQWRTGSVLIIGATNSTYTSTASGFYSVIEENINGCVGTSVSIFDTACLSVVVDSCDYYPQAMPNIIPAGVCKISSDILADSFVWYRDGFVLPGSDSMKVSVTVPGVYAVKCVNSHGCTATSTAISESCTTGVSELNNNSKIEIYPNPATDNVVVSGINGNFEIRLFDILGQEILTKKCDISENQFSVKNLIPGVYSLQVVYKGEILNQRLIKE